MGNNIISETSIKVFNNLNRNIMSKKNSEYMAKCSVKRRNWTKKMFDTFFPIPTMQVPNPHYRNAAPMKLYRIVDVLRIEQTEAFRNYWNRIAHKREVARAMMIERHRAANAKIVEMEQHTIGTSNQRA